MLIPQSHQVIADQRTSPSATASASTGNIIFASSTLQGFVEKNLYKMKFTGECLRNAISMRKFKLAKKCVEYGADVREKNEQYQTALQLAVTNTSFAEVINILPNYLAYVEEGLDDYVNSFIYATSARCEKTISRVSTKRMTDEFDSAGRLSLVKRLLTFGADVNSKDCNGVSPIQCAVYTGDLQLVKTLIEAGADLENRNRMGVTPLYDAILYCNLEMVQLLLSSGARVNAKTIDGETPLHWATLLNRKNSHSAIIKELLKYPVDVNSECSGITPFHCILTYANIDLMRHFIELNADMTKVDGYGRTCLYYAAPNEDKDVLNFIREKSDIAIDQKCDLAGFTPLHIASVTSRPDNIRLLINWGADVNAKDDDKATPLFVCVNHSQSSILRPNFEEDRRQAIGLLLDSGSDVNTQATVTRENQLRNRTTVLEEAIRRDDIDASKIIVEHVAAIEARTGELVFDEYNLKVIEETSGIKIHYEMCKVELTAMKNCKIENTLVTYFTMLTEPIHVLARYARNDDVLKAFKNVEHLNATYPIYSSRLRAKFDEAMVEHKLYEDVCNILSATLQFAEPSNPIFERIFKKLSTAEAKFLVDSASNESAN